MNKFDSIITMISCPICTFPNSVSTREIRFGLSVLCRGCKVNMRLSPLDGGLSNAKRILDDFENSFSGKMNIRL